MASLFSGIGGFDLGFERAGFDVTIQCEIDSFCNGILQQHWPKVRRLSDITEVDHAEIPVSDVWTGGFPCQDVSLAQMRPRAGLRGKRSRLFYEFSRLIGAARPRVVVIENVPGLLSSHRGRDFQIILRTLAEFGYSVGWRCLNSKYFGIPQMRERLFIVACYQEGEGPIEILFEPERGKGNPSANGSNGKKTVSGSTESTGASRKGPQVRKWAYCLYACSARHTGTDWSRNYVAYQGGRVRRLMPIEAERLQGFPDGWTCPEGRETDPERLDTLRYNALGNAVSVPVAEWIAKRVRTYLLSRNARVATRRPAPITR